MRRSLAGLLLLVLVALPAAALEWETDELAIETRDGEQHLFVVELALTDEQRARGLMFRESLADDAGMLFLYERDRPRSMWMKNTLIPLDMLFIDRRGRVIRIAERTTPLSERSISSGRPARAVLELAGGTAERLGIRVGDRVIYESFQDEDREASCS